MFKRFLAFEERNRNCITGVLLLILGFVVGVMLVLAAQYYEMVSKVNQQHFIVVQPEVPKELNSKI